MPSRVPERMLVTSHFNFEKHHSELERLTSSADFESAVSPTCQSARHKNANWVPNFQQVANAFIHGPAGL
jgi:hypothetical protein